MSFSPSIFSSLVRDASSMPEVRDEVVDAYKSRIQTGQYPSPDVIEALIDRMGAAWAERARAGRSSAN